MFDFCCAAQEVAVYVAASASSISKKADEVLRAFSTVGTASAFSAPVCLLLLTLVVLAEAEVVGDPDPGSVPVRLQNRVHAALEEATTAFALTAR